MMPRPRYEKLPPERRHAIMEAAAKELAARGFEGASLNRILEQANLSKGAAYYYFDGKEDLLATMFTYLWERLVGEMDMDINALTADTFWPTFEGIGEAFLASADEEPWLISAAKAIWGLPHEVRTGGPLGEAFITMEGWMAGIFQRGQALGVVRNDLPLGLLLAITLGMDEAADRWVFEHFEALDKREIERIWKIVFNIWKRVLAPEEE
jgi:AcrR family transcriptional regulator